MQKKLFDDYEIGIDEAGRGPLIGRVYAGAVIWGTNTKDNELIIDSKKLHFHLDWLQILFLWFLFYNLLLKLLKV